MNHLRLYPFLLILAFSCTQSPEPEDTPPRPPTDMERSLAKASGSFGLSLFRQVSTAEPATNMFISPLSVSLALGMTLNGAAGSTYDSMKAGLELYGLTQEEINGSYRTLSDLLLATDKHVSMEIANAVWYRNTFSVEQDFLNVLSQSFDARVEGIDFASPDAAPTINTWVSDATNQKISEIVKDPIPAEMVLYLINALYFKGNWSTQFDPANTADRPFTLPDNSVKNVPTMHQKGKVLASVGQNEVGLELTYGAGYYRMTFLMPTDGRTIEAFIAGLTEASWDQHIASLSEEDIDIYVPKFRMEYKRELKDDLAALGLGIAFDATRADLTRINPTADLYISKVTHKTFVQVDEMGTEAAAVTAVGVGVTSVPPNVTLNRPFVFAIRDGNTGTLVFIGKVVDPVW